MNREKRREVIRVSVASIGRGLTLLLSNEESPPPTSLKTRFPDDKIQHIASVATPWLTPFLEEMHIANNLPEVHGFVRLTNEGGLIRTQAELEFSPQLECVRCLELFQQKLSTTSTALFVDESTMSGNSKVHHGGKKHRREEETELQSDDLESYTFRGLSLDLDEFLLDTLQTSVPDLPLCRPECKGLCARCGTNLNHETSEHLC